MDKPQMRILVIHLGAMGAVVRATSLLAAMKRKFPSSHITWVTEAPMHLLLQNHPRIDRVLTTSSNDQLILRSLEFDAGFVIDKSLVATGLLSLTTVDLLYGFRADTRTGAIVPATEAARELWELGLDDHRKFYVNQKPETQLLIEALELGTYKRDEYDLALSSAEQRAVQERKTSWSLRQDQPVIGFNTGCGPLMPAKKWTVEFHRKVLQSLINQGFRNLVLLGGPEDADRNRQIGEGLPVIQSSCNSGVRDGMISIAATDLVITGDSFGMHLAIAMKKYVIAWFGPSCSHEIDLFERGEKISTALSCSPCWKRHCAKNQMCYDHVELNQIELAISKGIDWWKQRDPQIPQTSVHI